MSLEELQYILTEDIVVIPGDALVRPEHLEALEAPVQGKIVLPKASEKASSPTPNTSEKVVENGPEILYEGHFEKGVLVVYAGDDLLTQERELLMKVLQAVNCSLKDIALVSDQELLAFAPEKVEQLNPSKVIAFGGLKHAIARKLPEKKYHIQQSEATEYLLADELQFINAERNLKKALWQQLQLMFNIKR